MLIVPLILCSPKDPMKGNFTEMATTKGYTVEYHEVITPDGYILGLHRIPGPKGEPNMHRPPLLYFYGIVVIISYRTALTPLSLIKKNSLEDTYWQI